MNLNPLYFNELINSSNFNMCQHDKPINISRCLKTGHNWIICCSSYRLIFFAFLGRFFSHWIKSLCSTEDTYSSISDSFQIPELVICSPFLQKWIEEIETGDRTKCQLMQLMLFASNYSFLATTVAKCTWPSFIYVFYSISELKSSSFEHENRMACHYTSFYNTSRIRGEYIAWKIMPHIDNILEQYILSLLLKQLHIDETQHPFLAILSFHAWNLCNRAPIKAKNKNLIQLGLWSLEEEEGCREG